MASIFDTLLGVGKIAAQAPVDFFQGAYETTPAGQLEKQKRELEQQNSLLSQITNNPNLSQQQKLEALSQASPEFMQKRLELMLQPPKPLNAPNVVFNPATEEMMVTQYDPNTGQLMIQTPQGMQGGGMQQPVMPNMPQEGANQLGSNIPMPTMTPRAQREFDTARAKVDAEKATAIRSMEANLPKLGEVVKSLSALGNEATYSVTGRGVDFAREQLLNLPPREGSIARADYVSKVDNEVLPLLRDTFGAQFTQKEGESLKATLGDPDAPPAKKNAVLRSFITAKIGQMQAARAEFGLPPAEIPESILELQNIGKTKQETTGGVITPEQARAELARRRGGK